MSKVKRVVHLRVYKAYGQSNKVVNDENGIVNENNICKLTHNTLEWKNYLKHLRVNGFVKAEVEKVIIPVSGGYDDVEDYEDISKEVKKAMSSVDKALTPEQKKIAELEAKLDAILNNTKSKSKPTPTQVNEDKDALTDARERYVEAFQKKGHHSWGVEVLNQKIANKE